MSPLTVKKQSSKSTFRAELRINEDSRDEQIDDIFMQGLG